MVKKEISKRLSGEYNGKIIDGHRLALPANLRTIIGADCILTKGYEGCAILARSTDWNKLVEPLNSSSFLDRNIRDTLRFLVGSAFDVSLDSQGRFIVPETIREYSGISFKKGEEKEVVFLGLINWIEIWEKTRWVARNQYINANADSIAQELSNMNSKM